MIGIIDYGLGNIRSVQKALELLGHKAEISKDEKFLKSCDKIIVPGVGSFGAGIKTLYERGLADFIFDYKKTGKYILGICLGMQFLFTKSYEEGEHNGLNIVEGEVKRFQNLKIPHMGWNTAYDLKTKLFNGVNPTFYFVHSYFGVAKEENTIAKCDYGVTFSAGVRSENVFGLQFHPEKSGEAGLKLLDNFAKAVDL